MSTLTDLKASEVTLRNNLEAEKTKVFADDIKHKLKDVRKRRKELEGMLAIRKD